MNWFTTDQIDNRTFVISEYSHWEEVHSYLLIGNSKALLIDTGLGIGNIKDEIEKLTNLPIVVVSTHVHWDHIGGHKYFKEILVHKDEEKWLNEGIPVPLDVIKQNVMKDVDENKLPENFSIDNYQLYTGLASKILLDNDIIDIGSRRVKVIHTPGHSPGHMCFFEEEKGFLFSGDLIYKGTLYAFYHSTDPIKYKNSMERISKLEGIKQIFPSHHDLDLPLDFIEKVKDAFLSIESMGKLHHGGGMFKYDDFNILI